MVTNYINNCVLSFWCSQDCRALVQNKGSGQGFCFLTAAESVLQLFVVPVFLAVGLGCADCTHWHQRVRSSCHGAQEEFHC